VPEGKTVEAVQKKIVRGVIALAIGGLEGKTCGEIESDLGIAQAMGNAIASAMNLDPSYVDEVVVALKDRSACRRMLKGGAGRRLAATELEVNYKIAIPATDTQAFANPPTAATVTGAAFAEALAENLVTELKEVADLEVTVDSSTIVAEEPTVTEETVYEVVDVTEAPTPAPTEVVVETPAPTAAPAPETTAAAATPSGKAGAWRKAVPSVLPGLAVITAVSLQAWVV